MFIFVAGLILLVTSWFTAATWTHFSGWDAWTWQVAAIVTAVVFITVIFVSFRRQHVLLQVTGTLSAVAMGFLNYALVAAVASWVALGLIRLAGLSFDPAMIARGLFGCAIVVTLYGLVNAAMLRVTRVTVHLANLPEWWRGREVALVSDLHVGNIRGARFIRRVVARLKDLQPSAIFIGGDMFDGARVDIPHSVAPWTEFRATAGTYFVTGNHDEFSDRRAYLVELAAAGIHVLNNEKIDVRGLQIVGVHDSETHRPKIYAEILERARIDRGQASILLAHQPGHLEVPEDAGVSLQLSGHTHGGQFWPWSLLVRRIYRRFAYGLNQHGALQVFTSSGAGSWGPPMRVGTRSEIVVLRLEAKT
ncbi:MAG: Metallophosphoesterase [Verrucomicrobia bacterium]|nr:Metallophosphoesterase [Verrucomicrobiota bacterium]